MHYTALKSISPNRDSNDHGYKNLDSKLISDLLMIHIDYLFNYHVYKVYKHDGVIIYYHKSTYKYSLYPTHMTWYTSVY